MIEFALLCLFRHRWLPWSYSPVLKRSRRICARCRRVEITLGEDKR